MCCIHLEEPLARAQYAGLIMIFTRSPEHLRPDGVQNYTLRHSAQVAIGLEYSSRFSQYLCRTFCELLLNNRVYQLSLKG